MFILKQLINKEGGGRKIQLMMWNTQRWNKMEYDTVLSLKVLQNSAKVSGINYNTIRNEEKASSDLIMKKNQIYFDQLVVLSTKLPTIPSILIISVFDLCKVWV